MYSELIARVNSVSTRCGVVNLGRNSLVVDNIGAICSLELLEEDGDLLPIGSLGGVEENLFRGGRHGADWCPTASDAED